MSVHLRETDLCLPSVFSRALVKNEYVVLDASERSLVLDEWLSIIASVEQNGVAPYAEVSLEDATPLLTPLLLAGKKGQEGPYGLPGRTETSRRLKAL